MEYIIIITLLLVIIGQLTYNTYRTRSSGGIARKAKTYVDTSALMDGRILTVAQTGFIPSDLVITTSVLAELQLLADQADSEKRMRARAGLDAVAELQTLNTVKVHIYNDGPLDEGGVDARLVQLAKNKNAMLCTIDFNLNKVATVNGIFVLNLNELAQNIRMAFLPGETLDILLTQKGQDQHQAVGYLNDGTMVVVENAVKEIGQSVKVEFIRSLQTAAGRMMFAKLTSPSGSGKYTRTNALAQRSDKTTPKTTSPRARTSDKDDSRSKSRDDGRNTDSKHYSRKGEPKEAARQNDNVKGVKKRNKNVEDSLLDLVNNQ